MRTLDRLSVSSGAIDGNSDSALFNSEAKWELGATIESQLSGHRLCGSSHMLQTVENLTHIHLQHAP